MTSGPVTRTCTFSDIGANARTHTQTVTTGNSLFEVSLCYALAEWVVFSGPGRVRWLSPGLGAGHRAPQPGPGDIWALDEFLGQGPGGVSCFSAPPPRKAMSNNQNVYRHCPVRPGKRGCFTPRMRMTAWVDHPRLTRSEAEINW